MRPARDFPPKFERYNTWFTGEGVSLAFGDTEVTQVVPRWSEIWRFDPGLTVSFDPLFLFPFRSDFSSIQTLISRFGYLCSKQVQLPSELCWMNFCVPFLPWIWHPSNIFVRNLSFLLSCLLFNKNLPPKNPQKSREIGRFLREFVSSNPVKFQFFPANYQKPCVIDSYLWFFHPSNGSECHEIAAESQRFTATHITFQSCCITSRL